MEKVSFRDKTIYSKEYDDIYYHPDYGLEESFYVFIKGNDLDKELKNKQSIIIAELGFGTGLNFITLLKFIYENEITTKVDYYSIEKLPLEKEIIEKISKFFVDEKKYFDLMLENYPEFPENNINLRLKENINLNILIGDIKEKINELPNKVDYFFLDGFSPNKNPEMWSSQVFMAIKNKSKIGSKLATFSSSRLVKDGLKFAEFKYLLEKGFKNKRHMTKAWKE